MLEAKPETWNYVSLESNVSPGAVNYMWLL